MIRASAGWTLLLVACAPDSREIIVGQSGGIQAHLVVHVDPLPRQMGSAPCSDERLTNCGSLDGRVWRRRTRNLEWLTAEWIGRGRTMDLQLGPEAALGWMEDAAVLGSLSQTIGESEAEEVARAGRTAIAGLVDSGAASLGLHVHNVLADGSGTWGEYRVPEGTDPCAISVDEPGTELEDAWVEDLVHWSSWAVEPMALTAGTHISSFTAHTPRTMGAKITSVTQPDALDPATQRDFPGTFAPTSLGAAYSECFQQAVGHPPFEAYGADPVMALRAGGGVPIVPGNRVVGSMAPHLGADVDGSAEAALRRLVQLLLNWRVAALDGEADRPWVFAFHEHLFDLGAGAPDPDDREARQRSASNGQSFRLDLERLAEAVDSLAARSAWGGIEVPQGGVLEWTRPDVVHSEGSGFNYTTEDGEAITTFEAEHYPYLPLVAERLDNAHYRCSLNKHGTDIYVFERCDAGWAWGETASGYHCADAQSPQELAVLVRPVEGCMLFSLDDVRAAPTTASQMGDPDLCGPGIWVPQEGLILEARNAHVFSEDVCTAGVLDVLGG